MSEGQTQSTRALTAPADGLQVGWLQSHDSGEMDVAFAAVQRHAEVVRFLSVDEAIEALVARPLRAILLAQPRRGIWTAGDCDRLRNACLLTQLIGVHGSWCEGWHRTGHPWHGVENLYWHQVSGSIARILHSPAPPSTMDRDERFVQEEFLKPLRAFQLPTSVTVEVAISAPAPAFSAWRDALQQLGIGAFRYEEHDKATLGIWDGDPRFAADCRRLEELHQICSGRLLAIVLAPRLQDWRQIEPWTRDILTKPYLTADLHWWLGAQISSNAKMI